MLSSPRRRELLTQIGLDFDVVVSETEEKITSTEPAKVVEELSAQKAEAVWEKLAESGVCDPEQKSGETTMTDTLVLGADTVVACDGKILGKPADTEAAAKDTGNSNGQYHPGKGNHHIRNTHNNRIYLTAKITGQNTQRSAYCKNDRYQQQNTAQRIAGTIQNPTEIISPQLISSKKMFTRRRQISIFRTFPSEPVRKAS